MTDETISAALPRLDATNSEADPLAGVPIVLACVLVIVNIFGLCVVFLSDAYRTENVMGQLLNAASRTNGLLTLAVIDLVVIGAVLMIRR